MSTLITREKLAVLATAIAMFGFASPAYALTGAIYTTDSTCLGVNVNIFANKDAVYLDGGPHHNLASGLPDGSYFVKVTVPDGTLLGVPTTTPQAHVTNGSFDQCYQLSQILVKQSNSSIPGYDTTTNGGGVYKVWVSQDQTFANGTTKTDNFKVKGSTITPDVGSISGTKWEDINANGVFDGGENPLAGWTIQLWNAGHTTQLASTATDNVGYSFDNLTPGTYQVCEVMQATWFPSYPTMSVPNCNTGVVVTANTNTLGANFGNYQNATVTVHKNVVAPDGTTDVADTHSFSVTVDSTTKSFGEGADATYSVKPGTYFAVEGVDTNYTFVSDTGAVTVGSGGSATITIVNKQNFSHLIVIKHVINDNGGGAAAGAFTMSVSGTNPSPTSFPGVEGPGGTDVTLWSGSYTADETVGPSGYAKTLGTSCGAGSIGVGETKTCTITNDDIAPKLIVIKNVINDDWGTSVPPDFIMHIDGTVLNSTPIITPTISFSGAGNLNSASYLGGGAGVTTDLPMAGSYAVSESGPTAGYAATYSNCTGTIGIGETKTCTITNDDLHGRMTGGGSIFTVGDDIPANTRVTHGFELVCKDPTSVNNRLEINWNDKNGKSQKFHLTSLSTVACTENGNPAPPANTADGFNTFEGTGTGNLNGVPGATVHFTFVDLGEPGTADTASYTITKPVSTMVLSVTTKPLLKGNHQAHRF